MRRLGILIFSACCILLAFNYSIPDDFPTLEGPYLGQKSPGMTPKLFAPGIISTGVSEGCSYFSKDGQLYLFARAGSVEPGIFIMEQKDGVWSGPQLAPFSAGRHDWDFTLAPDGKTVFVASGRPHTKGGSPERDHSIWISERTKEGWTVPQLLPFPVNAGQHDSYPSITEDGTLYFFSNRSGGLGEGDIYKSERTDGKFTNVQNLGPPINTEFHEVDPFIAPNESYLIFCSNQPGGYGREDIYISFHKEDGSWTESVNLGESVNTPYDEYIPAVTPDGKYFFFTTNKTGNRDIYWVDAKILGQQENFPVLKGPYLGQKSPGNTSQVFMDGIICTIDNPEMCAAFTADGKEFYFNRRYKDRWTIFVTREVDGKWSTPKHITFSSTYTDRDFTMSPDGQRIYFGSNRPLREGEKLQKSLDIYVTSRGENRTWEEPTNLGKPINTPGFGQNYPSVSNNGNLYFFSCRNDGLGGCEIYMSQFSEGRYLAPVNLGPAVNSEKNDWDAFIAPDESYIIFSSQNREDTLGKQDLYISYKKEGIWTKALNMGRKVNSYSDEICPSLSLDGKYLFFTSRRRGEADIYWISSKIIQELKPVDLR